MILRSSPLSAIELETAKRATKDRAQSRRLLASSSDRVGTFPQQFEALRDRFLEHAKSTPAFLATVFTLNDGQPTDDGAAPSDSEILQSVENRLFALIHEYPLWFSQTPDADAKSHDLRRDHDITHGFIKAAPLTANQQAAIVRRKQERVEREEKIAARASHATMEC